MGADAWNRLVQNQRRSTHRPTDDLILSQTTHGATSELFQSVPRLNGTPKASPFKIIQAGTWLKYKVATGSVIIGGAPITPTYAGDGHVFTITGSVAKFYFCLVLTPTTAIVTTSSTLPVWAVDLIPIGWVDTLTGVATTTAAVHQFLSENVFSPCVV